MCGIFIKRKYLKHKKTIEKLRIEYKCAFLHVRVYHKKKNSENYSNLLRYA